jgi:pimeloyl-ACP methyl ester carboxylesterase
VNRRHRGMVALAAVPLIGIAAPRYLWFRRGRLPSECRQNTITSKGGIPLSTTCIARGRPHAIIVAHGFLKCTRTPGILWMMQQLADRFDVHALDFAGHGESGGASAMDFAAAGQDLACLVEHVRRQGYRRVAVVGYSMGAAAAMYAAAHGVPLDAVVSVCGPVRPPESLGQRPRSTALWRWWAALMGTRLDETLRPGPWPLEYVDRVAPTPLLIVHHEMDTLIRRTDSEALYAKARPPKDYLSVPGALHAIPPASGDAVIAWLEQRLAHTDPL